MAIARPIHSKPKLSGRSFVGQTAQGQNILKVLINQSKKASSLNYRQFAYANRLRGIRATGAQKCTELQSEQPRKQPPKSAA